MVGRAQRIGGSLFHCGCQAPWQNRDPALYASCYGFDHSGGRGYCGMHLLIHLPCVKGLLCAGFYVWNWKTNSKAGLTISNPLEFKIFDEI